MKSITIKEAAKLVKTKSAPAISIYLSTDVSDKEGTNKLWENLLRLFKKTEILIHRTYDSKTRERLLLPLKQALFQIRLRRSKGGIGIYHNEHFTGVVTLPTVTKDLAVASDSFHVKPVLRCVQLRQTYFLLTLKKNHADLLRISADETKHLVRIDIKLPLDRQLFSHERGFRHSIVDGIKLRRQKDLKEVMENLDRKLAPFWQGERIPLLLAGSSQHERAFREACTYMNTLKQGIPFSVDALDSPALASLSLGIMESHFCEMDHRSVAAFHKADASGLATTKLTEIAYAAARGQIRSLLVAEDRQVWGRLDRETGAIQILDHSCQTTTDDLLDDLAELTINKGGAVTVLPSAAMPKNQLIAAVLRWSDTPVAMPATHAIIQASWKRKQVANEELSA